MAVVLVAYLIIGLAMPVLPLYVHRQLGLSTFMVGVAAGVEFAAALLSRFWAGRYADTRGAKRAMVIGLLMGAAAGLLYLASLRFAAAPATALGILLLGRVFLGGAESFVITGALSQGLALGGPKHAGRVIAWVGTALWAAYAAGAPIGTLLYARYGFASTALATLLLPLVGLLLVIPLRGLPVSGHASPSVGRVLRAVAVPGLGMALTAVGFGTISTFGALLFAERGWDAAWIALTALSLAFILGRVVFGHLPDKIGGARVALVCVVIEAVGLALIWLRRRRSWCSSAPRSPDSDTPSSTPDSASRPCVLRHPKPGDSRWAPSPHSSISRSGSRTRRSDCSRLGRDSMRCFSSASSSCSPPRESRCGCCAPARRFDGHHGVRASGSVRDARAMVMEVQARATSSTTSA
jgi:MFS family permease